MCTIISGFPLIVTNSKIDIRPKYINLYLKMKLKYIKRFEIFTKIISLLQHEWSKSTVCTRGIHAKRKSTLTNILNENS